MSPLRGGPRVSCQAPACAAGFLEQLLGRLLHLATVSLLMMDNVVALAEEERAIVVVDIYSIEFDRQSNPSASVQALALSERDSDKGGRTT